MGQTSTPNVGLLKAVFNDPRWDTSYEELFDCLDEALMGWVRYGYLNPPAAGVANNQFSVPGDVTNLFPVGRKVRATLTGGPVVVTVSGASFDAGTNLTTVTTTETTLDGTLTDVWVCAFDVLYASGSTITVTGDKTAVFAAGLAIKVQLAASTVYGTVQSSSYSAGTGLTTVTLIASILTDPIRVLWVSPVRPVSAVDGNLPRDAIRGGGAESCRLYTYSHTITAGDVSSGVVNITATSVTPSKVRGVTLVYTMASGVVWSESYAYHNARVTSVRLSSEVNIEIGLGGSSAQNDKISVSILEAM